MAQLAEIDDDLRKALVSLPYKVGMWISHVDDEDGETDDEREQAALRQCIEALYELYEEGTFVSDVFEMTLTDQRHWETWAANTFRVPEETRSVLEQAKAVLDPQDFKGYAKSLLRIANAVAEAHGEFSSFDDPADEKGKFSAFFSKVLERFSGDVEEAHPMNVSPAEEEALGTLRGIIRELNV